MLQSTPDERVPFFDQLAEKWDSLGPPPEERLIRSFLAKLNGLAAGATFLDVGAGTGLLVPYLFELHPAKVYALDLSARMLEQLRDKYGERFGERLRLMHGDVQHLTLPDREVDATICNGVFPHFENKAKALGELFRVLKPGGTLLIHHFAGKEVINGIHADSSHPKIRQDLLEPAERTAERVRVAGFVTQKVVDTPVEYSVQASKPEND